MVTKFTSPKNISVRLTSLYIAILAVLLILPVTVFSQNGVPVCISPNSQVNPSMTTDGSGGTIVAWQDKRSGKNEIYAQRIGSTGNQLWTANGVAICTQDSSVNPIIVSDGTGGAIIAWLSYRGSITTDVFAQRVNSNGVVQWTGNGLPVCVVVFEQDSLTMISDGAGGAILAWQDYRSNNGFPDIFSQRVNNVGTMLWTANGVGICTQAAAQRGPKLLNDAGGAFITWYDFRAGNYDIYAQRVNNAGAPQWTAGGNAVCTFASNQIKPDICTDGAGGVIITWSDFRSTTDYNIYAQRLNPAGGIVWVVDGIVMNNNVAYDQSDPMIISDDLGGAIISWTDYRTSITADIYAQRVNSFGAVQWTATGVTICTATGDQIFSRLVSDGTNGAYITWEDHRNGGNSDVYAQRIASNGSLTWAATGFAICTIANDQLNPRIVSNGNLGCFVVWQDYRSGSNFDIYTTGFNTSGFITTVGSETTNPPEFALSQNYPNPFNPTTIISYDLPNSGNVKITIYDELGHVINLLVNESQNAGTHQIAWNAAGFPSGVYFYRIETGSFADNKKMILLK